MIIPHLVEDLLTVVLLHCKEPVSCLCSTLKRPECVVAADAPGASSDVKSSVTNRMAATSFVNGTDSFTKTKKVNAAMEFLSLRYPERFQNLDQPRASHNTNQAEVKATSWNLDANGSGGSLNCRATDRSDSSPNSFDGSSGALQIVKNAAECVDNRSLEENRVVSQQDPERLPMPPSSCTTVAEIRKELVPEVELLYAVGSPSAPESEKNRWQQGNQPLNQDCSLTKVNAESKQRDFNMNLEETKMNEWAADDAKVHQRFIAFVGRLRPNIVP